MKLLGVKLYEFNEKVGEWSRGRFRSCSLVYSFWNRTVKRTDEFCRPRSIVRTVRIWS